MMIFPFLIYLSQENLKICVCNNYCHADCPSNIFNSSSNNNFHEFLSSLAINEKYVELFFYSKQDGFTFSIDQTKFSHLNISIQILPKSQPIRLKINQLYLKKYQIIDIKPNYKITLPDLIPYHNKINALDVKSSEKPKTIPISIGLSNMKHTGAFKCAFFNDAPITDLTDDMDEKDFGCQYIDNLDKEAAYKCGLRCWTPKENLGGTLEYTFKGVKFELFGTKDPSHGIIKLELDGETIKVNETGEREEYISIYMSELLEYKEHTIKLSSEGVFELYKLTYWPSLTAKRLNVSDVVSIRGNWKMESDGIGGNRNYTDDEGTLIIPLHCKKFWLYGLKQLYNDNRKITVKYGDVTEEVNIKDGERKEQYLLYESPELDDFNFNLNISGRFMFCFLYYEDLTIPISIGLSLMNIEGKFMCSYKNLGNPIQLTHGLRNYNCEFNNLESIDASQCGLRCWTDGNTNTNCNLDYTFTGVKFALYGTFDPNHRKINIFIDGNKVCEVDEQSQNRKTFAVIYTSRNLPYGEHTVKIGTQGYPYEMYKLVYWPSLTSKRINASKAFAKQGTWTLQSDGIGGVQIYNEHNPSELGIPMHCTKFWLYGLKDNYNKYGKYNTLSYNEINREIDRNATVRTELSLLYESEDLSKFDFSLKIFGSLMFAFIYYEEPPIPLSVSIDQMETEGSIQCKFSDDGNNFPLSSNIDYSNSHCDFIYLDSPNAYKCGLKCWSSDGIYSYKFKGVKFAIYGASNNNGPFDIEFDGITIATINSQTSQNDLVLLYESEVYNVNEHKVRLISKNANFLIYKLVYWPSYEIKRMNSTHFTRTGNWLRKSDGIGGVVYYSQSDGCKSNVTIKCSQFWVYGIKDPNLDQIVLKYNDVTETINLKSETKTESVLLYQSPKFDFKSIDLTFTSSGKSMIYCIYYNDFHLQQPTITPIPISVGIQQMKPYELASEPNFVFECKNHKGESFDFTSTSNFDCSIDDLNSPDAYQCGLECKIAEMGFTYVFTGVKFMVIGTRYSISDIKIIVDNVSYGNFDLDTKGPELKYQVLYESGIFAYGEHTLQIETKISDPIGLYKIVYWPSLYAKRLNSSDFMTRTGIWTPESDKIGGIREYTINSMGNGIGNISKRFSCSKFWLYGSKAACFNKGFTISYDDVRYTMKDFTDPREDGVLLYESKEFTNKAITLREETLGESMFYFVYYLDGPLSLMEYIDKTFTRVLPYNNILISSDSYINQISGCELHSIEENIDYIITLEKEVLFNDNYFDENPSSSEFPSVLRIKYNGSIRLKNCTFTYSKGKSNNKACLFYCDENYKISATFDSCQFINCGYDNAAQGLITIENGQSSINITDCSFYSDSKTSSQPININTSNANLHNCSFKNTGGIYIAQQTDESSTTNKNEISITDCVFDSCYSQSKNVYTLGIQIQQQTSIIFNGNEIKNIQGTNNDVCIVSIDTNGKVGNLDIHNIRFVDNTCYSLYGGGTGIKIQKAEKISFYNCSFINNKARKCNIPRSSIYTLYNSNEDYYNGDGGGIQIGFECSTNEVLVTFEKCIFKDNKAERHGGAIAIQTLRTVEITDCIFESNYANYNFDSSSGLLEYDTHYHKKREGRGGAIYINPAYTYSSNGSPCYNQSLYMNPVTINNCNFTSNSARDGYAIYIEGDDPGTVFNIESNNFTDNYNFSPDVSSDPNITIRGIIATEIHSVPKSIENTNLFIKVQSKKLVYVDHYGNRITKEFTESDVFTYSVKFTESQLFSKSNDFTNSGKFTKSTDFSQSHKFTNSKEFSNSDKFSKSQIFSYSDRFTETQSFSVSKDFSKSGSFSNSKGFSKSGSFSNSKGFSKSLMFSETNYFSKTEKFSETQDFSISGEFTISGAFSKSGSFSNSKGFSRSLMFSETNYFSKTEKFSETQDFTVSEKFSKSNSFSDTFKFSKSTYFSNSREYTKSLIFSTTEKFSETNEFSLTISFSTSEKFTKSDSFKPSPIFTSSFYFSQTTPFSTSDKFSKSNQFSESQGFSPSITFPPSDPKCAVFDEGKYVLSNECKYSVDKERFVYVFVISSNFENYQQEEGDGAAFHLINCGILCNNTDFIDCVTNSGGGGAVFINNSFEIKNNCTFINTTFLRCKASFGGAVFLSAQSTLFDISFNACHFESNKALLSKPPNGENSHFFGGQALFVICRGLNVCNSTFTLNRGPTGAVKIISIQNANSKSIQLSDDQKSFNFIGCNFEQHEKSRSSIYYIDNENANDRIELLDCEFKGKLKKGSNYINGKVTNKEKLNVKSCTFEDDASKAIKVDSYVDEFYVKDGFSSISSKALLFAVGFVIVIASLVTIYLKSGDSSDGKYEQTDVNEEADFLI